MVLVLNFNKVGDIMSSVGSEINKGHEYSFFSVGKGVNSNSQKWKPCGSVYLALAVAICDAMLSSPFSASQAGINKLIQIYFRRHPIFNAPGKDTLWSSFKSLIMSDKITIVCKQLADTLYALTLQGLHENVTRYHEFALPQERRQNANQWIAKSAPNVIADILGLSIRLSIIASGRPLPASTFYEQQNGYKRIIDIRERHGQYSAKILNWETFQAISQEDANPNEDKALRLRLEDKFNTEINASLRKFNEFYQSALVMLNAGEFSKSTLIDLYINNLCPRLHGTQAFFDSIHIEEASHQLHMMLEILDAFARLVALGDLSKDLFFDFLQQNAQLPPKNAAQTQANFRR